MEFHIIIYASVSACVNVIYSLKYDLVLACGAGVILKILSDDSLHDDSLLLGFLTLFDSSYYITKA